MGLSLGIRIFKSKLDMGWVVTITDNQTPEVLHIKTKFDTNHDAWVYAQDKCTELRQEYDNLQS